ECIVLYGHREERLPNTLNVSFIGKIGQDILDNIPMLAASTGSACHSGNIHLSPVLKAMDVDEHTGKGAIRFSLGKYTTKEEIDIALQWLKKEIII
ncbi:MAG: aminotransferase class V-fold PLP-dependent enzyme, partial [Bacilli bacterium]